MKLCGQHNPSPFCNAPVSTCTCGTKDSIDPRDGEIAALKASLKEARDMLAEFKVFGSDGCMTCDDGRITLYFKVGHCLTCAPKAPTGESK